MRASRGAVAYCASRERRVPVTRSCAPLRVSWRSAWVSVATTSTSQICHGVAANAGGREEPAVELTTLSCRSLRRSRTYGAAGADDAGDLHPQHHCRCRRPKEVLREHHHGVMSDQLRHRPGTASQNCFVGRGGIRIAHVSWYRAGHYNDDASAKTLQLEQICPDYCGFGDA